MSTLTLKELSAPTGEVIKIAAGKTLDLKTQGSVTMPTGSVLQVVSIGSDNSPNIATTSTSLVASGLQLNISPKQTGSKLFIDWVTPMSYVQSGSYLKAQMFRDGVGLGTTNYSMLHQSANGTYYGTTAYSMVYTAGAAGTNILFEPWFLAANGTDTRLLHPSSSYLLRVTEVSV